MTPRAVVYGRVSSEEQARGNSVSDQDKASRALIDARGWMCGRSYLDEGQSGKSFDRSQWLQLVRDAQARQFDIVVFDRIDRISRATVLDALQTMEAMRKHGVSFVSVSEPLDFTHPAGEVMMLLLLWFARQYLVNLNRVVTRGKKSRAEAGRSNANRPPFGYRRVYVTAPDGKVISSHDEPDPETQGVAREIFMRAAQPTETALTLMQWLNAAGHTMPSGKAFSRAAIQGILRNKFYAGFIRYQGLREALDDRKRRAWRDVQWFRGTHEAIITEDEYARVQLANERRRTTSIGAVRADKRADVYTLRGLLVCTHCGSPMHGSRSKTGEARYSCSRAVQGHECKAGTRQVSEALLLPSVDTMMQSVTIRANVIDAAVECAQAESDTLTPAPRIAEIDAELKRLDHMYQRGRKLQAEYDSEVDSLMTERERLVVIKPITPAVAASEIASLSDAWRLSESPEIRRAILAALLDYIEVDAITRTVTAWHFAPDFAMLGNASGPGDETRPA